MEHVTPGGGVYEETFDYCSMIPEDAQRLISTFIPRDEEGPLRRSCKAWNSVLVRQCPHTSNAFRFTNGDSFDLPQKTTRIRISTAPPHTLIQEDLPFWKPPRSMRRLCKQPLFVRWLMHSTLPVQTPALHNPAHWHVKSSPSTGVVLSRMAPEDGAHCTGLFSPGLASLVKPPPVENTSAGGAAASGLQPPDPICGEQAGAAGRGAGSSKDELALGMKKPKAALPVSRVKPPKSTSCRDRGTGAIRLTFDNETIAELMSIIGFLAGKNDQVHLVAEMVRRCGVEPRQLGRTVPSDLSFAAIMAYVNGFLQRPASCTASVLQELRSISKVIDTVTRSSYISEWAVLEAIYPDLMMLFYTGTIKKLRYERILVSLTLDDTYRLIRIVMDTKSPDVRLTCVHRRTWPDRDGPQREELASHLRPLLNVQFPDRPALQDASPIAVTPLLASPALDQLLPLVSHSLYQPRRGAWHLGAPKVKFRGEEPSAGEPGTAQKHVVTFSPRVGKRTVTAHSNPDPNDTRPMCSVCETAKACVIFIDCGHMAACASCVVTEGFGPQPLPPVVQGPPQGVFPSPPHADVPPRRTNCPACQKVIRCLPVEVDVKALLASYTDTVLPTPVQPASTPLFSEGGPSSLPPVFTIEEQGGKEEKQGGPPASKRARTLPQPMMASNLRGRRGKRPEGADAVVNSLALSPAPTREPAPNLDEAEMAVAESKASTSGARRGKKAKVADFLSKDNK